MPLDFAVFKINAANGIREQFPEIDRWFIGGHSVGGAMAASYVAKHTEDFEGLVLLGAYSTADLSNSGLKVFTAYGTQDGVINRRSYSRNLANLPQGSQELIIIGGCHAFFGDYGSQFGDGHPYTTCEQQMQYTVDGFVRMIIE